MTPFTSEKNESVRSLGEVALIECIRQWLGEANPPAPQGIGDDCALMTPEAGKTLLVSTDALLWGRHVDDSATPEQAGEKLYKRNLSDVAAMGGEPMGAVVALLLSEEVSLEWLEGFYRGMARVGHAYGSPVVGGDITHVQGEHLSAVMTIMGQAKRPLRRAGAKPGDTLWVTGTLGGSILGRHLSFEPRIPEGQWLAQREEVCAMMDVSDGLLKDLPALLGKDCIGIMDTENIPISEDAVTLSVSSGREALAHALGDGEDYELLFALNEDCDKVEFAQAFAQVFEVSLSCVGEVRSRDDSAQPVLLDSKSGEALMPGGYEYFR